MVVVDGGDTEVGVAAVTVKYAIIVIVVIVAGNRAKSQDLPIPRSAHLYCKVSVFLSIQFSLLLHHK